MTKETLAKEINNTDLINNNEYTAIYAFFNDFNERELIAIVNNNYDKIITAYNKIHQLKIKENETNIKRFKTEFIAAYNNLIHKNRRH